MNYNHYNYYKIFGILNRVPKNIKHSGLANDHVERYFDNKWVKGNFITNIEIERYHKSKQITDEEAFMELL